MRQGRSDEADRRTPEAGSDDGSGTRRPGALRWKAGLTALLLLAAGVVLGITVDRLWLTGAPEAEAAELTVAAMARSLDLAPADRARVQRLLDSLEVEVAEAAGSGPDSLRSVARRARARLEGALPPAARPEFRRWMQGQHRRMMERMHGPGAAPMHPDMMGPTHRDGMGPRHREGRGGMMRPDTPRGRR